MKSCTESSKGRVLLHRSSKKIKLTYLLFLALSKFAWAREPVKVAGRWDITIQFVRCTGNYTAFLEQAGEKLSGTYRGRFIEGELEGTIQGNQIRFRGDLKIEGTRLFYSYTGTVEDDRMEGTVDMDEYGEAHWTAKKH